jgi:hypothetical protein
VTPIYKQCERIISIINETALPLMKETYKKNIKEIESNIINNENLNRVRQYSVAAKVALNSNQIDNKYVRRYLNELIEIGKKLDKHSRELHDKLVELKSNYIKKNKKLSRLNNDYVYNMYNSDIPAEELLNKLKQLGKDIKNIINDELPNYKKEIDSFIKKIEDNIVDNAFANYNNIQKLDSGTLQDIRTREWTYLPNELFRTPGAFINNNYDT